MSASRWTLIFPTIGALLSGSCAPVQPPAPAEGAAAESKAVEYVARYPTPMPVRDATRARVEAAIDNVRQRDLLTTNGFWTVFHGILGLGPSVTLRHPETGQRVNAIEYICNGGEMRGLAFIPTRYGLDVQMGPASVGQGHQDQFIAEMGQWGMPLEQRFLVYGKPYTFYDFVHHAQMRARVTANQELSWAICVIGQYLGTDIAWTNAHGEVIYFEDMIRYELEAPVESAACGGTHRLFGLTWARNFHLLRGGRNEGVWKEVEEKVRKYRDLARQYQNPDGSFSTNFFREPGNSSDRMLRINTTGHIFEWLALALTDEELRQPWVQDAANALSLMILELQGAPIEGGALYHAVHGLIMYHHRMYDPDTPCPPAPLVPLPGMRGNTARS
ncbi:MAG: hypothetical protein NZ700_04930 [Gemmataceae bacterium]|nr:hypothetical protein [Gemmataceae bacterium]MDW8267446.1 hypothetical protein [Gemmataceae bacterium]